MGVQNDVLLDYFDDNSRFADLFNGVLLRGRPEICPEELEEASERYTQREEMRRLINDRQEYRKLDKETMEVIATMTGSRKLMEDLEAYRTSEESYDMCEAMKGIQEEGIEIGRELGRKQGIEQGIEQGIRGMAELFQELGLPDERIIGKLSEKFSMSRQKAEKMLADIKR